MPESTPTTPETDGPVKPKRRKRRRWLRVLVVLVLLLVLVVVLLPTALSTGAGNRVLLDQVNQRLPGTVRAGSVRVGWLSSPVLKDVELLDPDGATVATIESVTMRDASLLSLARTRGRVIDVTVAGVEADVVRESGGGTNAERAVSRGRAAPRPAREPMTLPAGLSVRVRAERVNVRYHASPDALPVSLRIDEATATAAGLDDVALNLSGSIEHGGRVSPVLVEGVAMGFVGGDGALTLERGELEADVLIESLPVAALDAVLDAAAAPGSPTGRLVALLGESATVSGYVIGPMDGAQGHVSVTTPGDELGVTLAASYDGQAVTLTQPVSGHLVVTPEAAAVFNDAVALDAPVRVELALASLVLPVADGALDVAAVSVMGEVTVSDASAMVPDVGTVALRGTRVALESDGLASGVRATLVSDASLDDRPGRVEVAGEVTGLVDAAGAMAMGGAAVDVTATLVDTPVAPIVDTLLAMEGRLAALLGDTMTVTASASGPVDDVAGRLTVATPDEALAVDAALAYDGESVRLTEPMSAHVTATPEAAARWSDAAALEGPVVVTVGLDALTVPLRGGRPVLGAVSLGGELVVSDVSATVAEVGSVALSGTRLTLDSVGLAAGLVASLQADAALDGEPGRVEVEAVVSGLLDDVGALSVGGAAVDVTATLVDTPVGPIADAVADLDGWATAALGRSVDAMVRADVRPGAGDAGGAGAAGLLNGPVTVEASGAGWTLETAATVADGVVRVPSATLRYVVPDAVVAKLNESQPFEGETLTLANDTTVVVSVTDVAASLADFALADVTAGARVAVDRVAPAGVARLNGTAVTRLTVELPASRLGDVLTVTVDGKARRHRQQGGFNGAATLTLVGEDGATSPALERASLNVTDLPVVLVETLARQADKLTPVLGDTIEGAEVVVVGDPREAADVTVRVTGEVASASADLAVATDDAGVRTVSATGPVTASLLLDEQRLAPLVEASAEGSVLRRLRIDGRSRVELRADTLTLALGEDGPVWNRLATDATLTAGGLRLKDEAGEVVALSRVRARAETANPLWSTAVTVRAMEAGAERPVVVIDGDVTGLRLGEANALDFDGLGFRGRADVNELASSLVDRVAGTGDLLGSVLGSVVTVNVDGGFPGDMTVSFTAPAVTMTLPLHADDTSLLTLSEDATLRFDVRQLTDQALLQKIHPLLGFLQATRTLALDPVELTLSQGGAIPLDGFDLSRLQLGGELRFGEMRFDDDADLAAVFVEYALGQQAQVFGGGANGGGLMQTLNTVNQALVLAGEEPLMELGELRAPAADDGWGVAEGTSEATFTPVSFSLQDGVFRTGEGWLQTRGIQLGFTGGTDLVTGQTRYAVGVPGEAIIALEDELAAFIDPARVYEFNLSGAAGGDLTAASPSMVTFLQDGVNRYLQAELQEQAGRALGDQVGGELGDQLGGLLGDLLGGGRPGGGIAPPGVGAPVDAPQTAHDWTVPGAAAEP